VIIRAVVFDDQLDIAHEKVSGCEFRVSGWNSKL